ncbi:unnamed protein product [Coregonus sp. 'balchen']|nr:unnamed protein product [Coregonus sp. 'balchen']
MVSSYPLPDGFSDIDVFSLGSCLLVEGLLGFFLNAVTVAAFIKIRELRTPSNFLVFSLALADMGISANATIAAFSSFLRYWPYGSDGCQTHGFQGFVTALASIHFIAAIAWDRYHQYCTMEQCHHSDYLHLAVHRLLVRHAPHRLGRELCVLLDPHGHFQHGRPDFCCHVLLQLAPILAKTSPTFNVFLYALGNENYRGGIWQFLTGEKIEVPKIENKSK